MRKIGGVVQDEAVDSEVDGVSELKGMGGVVGRMRDRRGELRGEKGLEWRIHELVNRKIVFSKRPSPI
jgi:hypothetical protein